MLQWKVLIRKRKVERLRYTIINHKHYKTSLQLAVNDWKSFVQKRKEIRTGLKNLTDTVSTHLESVFITFLRHNMLQDRDLDKKASKLSSLDLGVR